jgi:hypothetical protein
MQQFHTAFEFDEYAGETGAWGYFLSMIYRAGMILWAYLRPMLLLVPLIVAMVSFRHRRRVVMSILICTTVLMLHMIICPWMRISYMAPIAGLLLMLVGLGLQRIDRWQFKNEPLGRVLVRAIVVTHVIVGVFSLVNFSRATSRSAFVQRNQLIHDLRAQGGGHLVLVKYGKGHAPTSEWVYNDADIDASPVVFARSLGAAEDEQLLAYFSTRKVWRLDITNHEVIVHAPLNDSSRFAGTNEP